MLRLKVEATAGSLLPDILSEMALVAARTGCMVVADLNGVEAMVKPGSDPREAWAQWQAVADSKREHKVFCAQPIDVLDPRGGYQPRPSGTPPKAPRKSP